MPISSINGEPITIGATDSVTDEMLVQSGGILSKSAANAVQGSEYGIQYFIGSINDTTHQPIENNKRLLSQMLEFNSGDMVYCISDDCRVNVHLFDLTGTYVGHTGGWATVSVIPDNMLGRIIVRKEPNDTIDESELETLAGKVRVSSSKITYVQTRKYVKQNAINAVEWSNRIWSAQANRWAVGGTRICTAEVILAIEDTTIIPDDGYKISVITFSGPQADTTQSATGWMTSPYTVRKGTYFLVNAAMTSDAPIDATYSDHIKLSQFAPIVNRLDGIDLKLDTDSDTVWYRGGVNADGSDNLNANAMRAGQIVSPTSMSLGGNVRAVIRLYSDGVYLGKVNSSGGVDKAQGNWKYFYGDVDLSGLLIEHQANAIDTAIYPTDSTNVSEMTDSDALAWATANCTIYIEKYLNAKWFYDNYGVGEKSGTVSSADLVARPVKTVSLGTLSGHQSFCMYGGKYYSTDGSSVFVQNALFEQEQAVTLDVGHGNSLQIGNGSTAYASGWNDNKIHKIDLTTLTQLGDINLPTTGYTTAAIDEDNGIAYIFQRNDSPSGVGNYNFIKYDFIGDNVISSKIIKAFAAMQACDYYCGLIAVAYGLGTEVAPSGLFVCNTNGDILSEYSLDMLATVEPEGVFIDRDTRELMVSLVNRQVYRIKTS